MPTPEDYEYIDGRLNSTVSRSHMMSLEGCKAHDIPCFWISKGKGDGSQWTVAKFNNEFYMVKQMGKQYVYDGKSLDNVPIPILDSGRKVIPD